MKPLTIGEVARRVGIGVETVRFYERQGLIRDPARSASGYRQFGEETIARLLFIRQAKELGFTLNEINELLTLRFDPTSSCAEVKVRAEAKIADVEEKIRTLQRIKKILVKLTESCSGEGPTHTCPILAAIEPAQTGRKL